MLLSSVRFSPALAQNNSLNRAKSSEAKFPIMKKGAPNGDRFELSFKSSPADTWAQKDARNALERFRYTRNIGIINEIVKNVETWEQSKLIVMLAQNGNSQYKTSYNKFKDVNNIGTIVRYVKTKDHADIIERLCDMKSDFKRDKTGCYADRYSEVSIAHLAASTRTPEKQGLLRCLLIVPDPDFSDTHEMYENILREADTPELTELAKKMAFVKKDLTSLYLDLMQRKNEKPGKEQIIPMGNVRAPKLLENPVQATLAIKIGQMRGLKNEYLFEVEDIEKIVKNIKTEDDAEWRHEVLEKITNHRKDKNFIDKIFNKQRYAKGDLEINNSQIADILGSINSKEDAKWKSDFVIQLAVKNSKNEKFNRLNGEQIKQLVIDTDSKEQADARLKVLEALGSLTKKNTKNLYEGQWRDEHRVETKDYKCIQNNDLFDIILDTKGKEDAKKKVKKGLLLYEHKCKDTIEDKGILENSSFIKEKLLGLGNQ